jgi:hypothetical protein
MWTNMAAELNSAYKVKNIFVLMRSFSWSAPVPTFSLATAEFATETLFLSGIPQLSQFGQPRQVSLVEPQGLHSRPRCCRGPLRLPRKIRHPISDLSCLLKGCHCIDVTARIHHRIFHSSRPFPLYHHHLHVFMPRPDSSQV